MLKVADLANRPDFTAGPLRVSPARRLVEGPGGRAHLEPIVMKVFLLLLDSGGSVITRDELFGSAWGGAFVGDDSLNRAIGRVRKVAAETAAGLFEIETVPRTGYRLMGPILSMLDEYPDARGRGEHQVSRRLLLGSAVGAGLLAAGGTLWWVSRSPQHSTFDTIMDRARAALNRSDDQNPAMIASLRQAVRLRPDNAEAWGMLALMQTEAPPGQAGTGQTMIADAAASARQALSLDPKEPSALLAVYDLEGSTLDWFQRDQRLRSIIALGPKHVPAINQLVALLQSAGLNRESWDWNERAIRIEPLSPELLSRRALKLWIARRTDEADKVIDQARDTWPADPFVWWVRFLILATTGRAAAAQTMLDSDPKLRLPPWLALWRASLPAMTSPTPANLDPARKACTHAARSAGGLAIQAVMILGVLDQVDLAFDICNGFLLWRGSVVRAGDNKAAQLGSDSGWRMSIQWLFTPPAAKMRSDPRFLALCDAVGLSDYWKKRGVQPDYLRIEHR